MPLGKIGTMFLHAVVLCGLENEYLVVMDPAVGEYVELPGTSTTDFMIGGFTGMRICGVLPSA